MLNQDNGNSEIFFEFDEYEQSTQPFLVGSYPQLVHQGKEFLVLLQVHEQFPNDVVVRKPSFSQVYLPLIQVEDSQEFHSFCF